MLAGQKLTLFIFFICLQISTKLNLWHERKINELKVERCPVLPKYCRVPIVPTIIREYCSYNYQGILFLQLSGNIVPTIIREFVNIFHRFLYWSWSFEFTLHLFIYLDLLFIYYIFGFTLHLLYIWIVCLFVCIYLGVFVSFSFFLKTIALCLEKNYPLVLNIQNTKNSPERFLPSDFLIKNAFFL